MSDPLVSIVLLTRNGASTLPAVLAAIGRQQVDFAYETVAIDSGSTDGTRQLLERSIDRVLSIRSDAFDHGLTRNLGIEQARGTVIVLLVQDAIPQSDRWLSGLVAPLLADPAVAGTYCRQQPRADANALVRHYLGMWIATSDEPRVVAFANRDAFDRLDPMEQLVACVFDNVCSCLRRSVWEKIPFVATPIAEDLEWSRSVLLAGHRLAYVPTVTVEHSHDRPASYEFARTYVLHRRLFALFGLRTIPTGRTLLLSIAGSLRLHARVLRGAPFRVRMRGLALALAWPLGQYLGGLSAARGWRAIRFRTV